MDLRQAEILLEKINRLFKSMKMDEENISRIEKDLMINYIREYYELFIPDEDAPKAVKPRKKTRPAVQEYIPTAEVSDPELDAIPVEKPKPVVREQPVRKVVREEIPVRQPEPEPAPPAPVVSKPKVEPAPTPPMPEPVIAASTNSDHDLIFEAETGRDLSDRLKALPIRDFTKAFSINDKILTKNNLFDGDSLTFNVVLEKINSLNSFEEAKVYLSENVIDKFDWTDSKRLKAAKAFVQLVARRFKA